MKKLHLISGLVLMCFAALICFVAGKLPFGTLKSPGPALAPFGSGILLFLLTVIFVWKSAPRTGKWSDSAGALWRGLRWKRVLCTLFSLIAYALLLEKLGYLIATSMLMFSLFWAKGPRRGLIALAGALGVSILSFIFFDVVLKVRLPAGILGI
jgi:putative tricarboxylic transport membrane protein